MDINTIMPAKCEKMVQEQVGTKGGLEDTQKVYAYNSEKMTVIGLNVHHDKEDNWKTQVQFILKSPKGHYFMQTVLFKHMGGGFIKEETIHVSNLFPERAIYWYLLTENKRMSFLEAFGFEPEDA